MTERVKATLETLTPSAGEVERLRAQAFEEAAKVAKAYPSQPPFGDLYEATGLIGEGQDSAATDIADAILALADDTPSPPLPHPDIEGRARELLAAEYDLDVTKHEAIGYKNAADNQRQKAADIRRGAAELHAIRAIVKALSLPTTEIRREAWQPIETAPHAVTVLACRFDDSFGEWIYAVVLSPPSHPFTHWQPLPRDPSKEEGR